MVNKMLFKKNKKNISVILIISILSLNLSFFSFPTTTGAVAPVFDSAANALLTTVSATLTKSAATLSKIAGTTAAETKETVKGNVWDNILKYIKEKALGNLAKAAAIELVHQLTNSIVDWINSGFDGQPTFISDPGTFLQDIGDKAVGDMIMNSPEMNFLCEPFQIQVKVALGLQFGSGRFKENIGCTLTDVVDNVTNAIDTTSVLINGKKFAYNSWEHFLEVTQNPQNTPLGAFVIAKAELESKIAFNKESKILELSWGQGALTFSECTKYFYEEDGIYMTRNPEKVKGTLGTIDTTPPPGTAIVKVKDCKTKTPGSTITTMLGFKATQDPRYAEIHAATTQGIDNIFGALMGQAINMLKSKLKEGFLNNPNDEKSAADYRAFISNLNAQTYQNYYTEMNAVTSAEITDSWETLGMGIPAQSSVETGTSSTSTTNTIGGFSGLGNGGAFDQARNNAITLINSLSSMESAYQNTQLIARNVLTQGRAVFASSSICNYDYNRADAAFRASMIRSNVLTNIDGVNDSNRIIATIPWNLPVISMSLLVSNSHMDILSTAANAVNSSNTIGEMQTAMIQVNSTNFNTDPQSNLVPNIKTWLSGVRDMYNSRICPIDLTQVLQINSATGMGN